MNIMILVPKVIRSYRANFPSTWHNAYPYFNYDNRVVEERVPRDDYRRAWQDPDDFTDVEYDGLVHHAQTLVNPILLKYSPRVAHEDALSTAIRSYDNGRFDGKVNANRYNVLLDSMSDRTLMAAKKKKKEEKPKEVKPHTLKQLGLTPKDVPLKSRIRERKYQKAPRLYKTRGRTVID